ncbi:MAG: galactokinase [Anaerosolibacter sp.]|jgi:galactokinase|nr:galactokinase [Anaerosolibacter sp.]MDF2545420.1 galactokinase [Anaerosolibacter sp.]
MMNLEMLIHDFTNRFGGEEGIMTFFAPGRVNLIGEHTDYNGGHVFPCALSFGTYAVARKRNDTKIRLFSKNFEDFGTIEVDISSLSYNDANDWANYPIGMVKIFRDAGYQVESGFDVLYDGNIPNGAGLSSSASIELVTSVLLKSLYNLDIDMIEMVKMSQRAENQFVGVNCGIMDQFASGMGKKDHAMLLDTNTLKYAYVPIKTKGITIVIANTNKRRSLSGSKYNERRSECENALKALQQELEISSLGDLTEERFDAYQHLIQSGIEQRRARHAVYENQRTLKAVNALNAGNIQLFGELMNASHISLRDDYEVTGIELDTLVEAAWENEAIGSRMTGAGFGGCTVSLVHEEKVHKFIENVGNIYEEKIGYKADFYVVAIGDGARQI